MRRLPVLAIALAAAASCGGPDTGPRSPTPSSPVDVSPTPTVTGTSGVPTGLLAPDPGATPPAPLVIATDEGVIFVDVDGSVRELVRGRTALAMDDTAGGLVFQTHRGRYDTPEGSTTIYRVARGTGSAAALASPGEGESLHLHEALELDGEVAVFFTLEKGSVPDDRVDTLMRLDASSGATAEVARIGGWEWVSDPVSVTPTLIALTWFAEARSGFEFLTHAGEAVEVPANPAAVPSVDCSSCPSLVELSDDGAMMAYVGLGPDEGGFLIIPELVLRKLDSPREVLRLRLARPDQGWLPASLDLGRGVVVVNRLQNDRSGQARAEAPWVIDLRGERPVVWEAPVAGVARLARSTPQVEGPIDLP